MMDCQDKYISNLESQIQYFKKLLDENGISYDYEAHLRALQSDIGDIVFPELGPEYASLLYSYFKDEGMFMRREHAMVKATIHSVIISGSQESVLKGVVSR